MIGRIKKIYIMQFSFPAFSFPFTLFHSLCVDLSVSTDCRLLLNNEQLLLSKGKLSVYNIRLLRINAPKEHGASLKIPESQPQLTLKAKMNSDWQTEMWCKHQRCEGEWKFNLFEVILRYLIIEIIQVTRFKSKAF